MKIERFEDFVAWQKARILAKEIYGATRQGAFSRDFGLAGQIQRAAVSIMSNIAEGFERRKRTEFHQFLSVAKASAAEVKSHLYVALDAGYLTRERFELLFGQTEEVACLVGALRAVVEKQREADSR